MRPGYRHQDNAASDLQDIPSRDWFAIVSGSIPVLFPTHDVASSIPPLAFFFQL